MADSNILPFLNGIKVYKNFGLHGKWDMSGMNKRLLKTLNYGTKREEKKEACD